MGVRIVFDPLRDAKDTARMGRPPIDPKRRDAASARGARLAGTETGALAPGAAPPDLESVFVSLYAHGQLCACMGAPVDGDLDGALTKAIDATLSDDRFGRAAHEVAPDAIAVSLLYSPCEWDDLSPDRIAPLVRPGGQALLVHQGARQALLLPSFAAAEHLDRHALALAVVDKAGITRPPYDWCVYECATWFAAAESE